MSPDYFVSVINQYLPEPQASLLAGMLFGQKYSHMPIQLYNDLVTTGTLHVVALSGTNVSILIRVVDKVFGSLGRKFGFISTMITISLFVLMVGADPPIVRATIMGGISTLTSYIGRRTYVIYSLIFTAAIMLLLKPAWLTSLSFQLSFFATLGIILLDNRGQKPHSRNVQIGLVASWFKFIFLENLRTTLSAQVFITPLLVYNFGRLSLVAPLTNALGLWVVEYITWLGILLVIVGALLRPLGALLAIILWLLLTIFIIIVKTTALIPFAQINFY